MNGYAIGGYVATLVVLALYSLRVLARARAIGRTLPAGDEQWR